MSGALTAFVFARGGSKGLPGKNLRLLGGKSLLAHAVETALAVDRIDRVVVSTDDEAIAAEARNVGAEVPFMRPDDLAGDASPEWLAWRHALEKMAEVDGKPLDVFVSVPTVSPLRRAEDVAACIERFDEGDVDVAFVVTEARRSPYFNMVSLDAAGHAGLVIPPSELHHRRQDVPVVYDMTTVCYVARADFVRRADGLFDGKAGVSVVPPERAVDVDTALDMRIAEALYADREG